MGTRWAARASTNAGVVARHPRHGCGPDRRDALQAGRGSPRRAPRAPASRPGWARRRARSRRAGVQGPGRAGGPDMRNPAPLTRTCSGGYDDWPGSGSATGRTGMRPAAASRCDERVSGSGEHLAGPTRFKLDDDAGRGGVPAPIHQQVLDPDRDALPTAARWSTCTPVQPFTYEGLFP